MDQNSAPLHGLWTSRWTFVLAATGSAVGLGNVWKFPYITDVNGGGAFVLVYLGCILLITLPIMMAEIMLGRAGRRSPVNTMRALARQAGASRLWMAVGWLGLTAGFLILSYYSVIAGWTIAYVPRAAAGDFAGLDGAGIAAEFAALLADPAELVIWHSFFMLMTVGVISRGVSQGLERAVSVLMPGLFVLLLVLLGYALTLDGFGAGVAYLFRPDFSQLSGAGFLAALGQAFFTLSIGMGAIMAYGAYLPDETNLASTTLFVGAADTLVALVAGLVVFALVFSTGLEPAAGPGLIFETLPHAFGQMPGGAIIGGVFFLLLMVAAWTSAISLLEPAVAWLVERFDITRPAAAAGCGAVAWLLGLGTLFSFNLLADFKPVAGRTLFDLTDYLTSNIMLPLGGLLIALFVAWRMSDATRRAEAGLGGPLYTGWLWLLRVVAPLGVLLVFLSAVGVELF